MDGAVREAQPVKNSITTKVRRFFIKIKQRKMRDAIYNIPYLEVELCLYLPVELITKQHR